MSSKLQPYQDYADTGLLWLGKLPGHWKVLPNRALFAEVKEREHPDEPLLSVTISKGVIRQQDLLANSSQKDSSNLDKSKYKLVQPGDLAYNKMRAWQGAVGVSKYRGIVSPAYIVVRRRKNENPDYFHYLLRTPAFAKEAERWSYGITSDQWSLRAEDFKQIYCCLPPRSEQDAMVRFLIHQECQINRLIRAKRRLIELLNEQKQAIIHRAVTRGLDPSVRLKPSGIEWLGDVPENWDIVPLKKVSVVQSGLTLGKNYGAASLVEFPYLRVANVQDGHLDLTNIKTVLVPEREAFRSTLRAGDVLMTEGGDPDKLGRGCVWDGQVPGCLHQNHIFAVRPERSRLDPHFLALLLVSLHAKTYFLKTAKQTTNLASTNKSNIGRFPVLLPALDEQRETISALGEETADIDRLLSRAREEIALLREYRTRLIADVVTGKLDVRGVELPALDEAEALEDVDIEEDADGEETPEGEEAA